ncbi:prominin-1-A isoform X5 [Denticeps clupeoides]|uniref:prominin-1-A isoform X5 n=1 Tax=Denticeps clupeoides TaxID=299321 RepID=UPI0010A2D5DA|nr:prominin-1 isoform X5 [Denticeps clupeoides]
MTPARSAAWTVSLLLLCRGLGSGAGGEPRSSPRSATLDFGYVPSGVYETLAHHEPGPIGILFHMVHAFLYVVQPNPFPQDLVIRVAKDKFGAIQTEYQKPENIVLTLQAIYYEIGFVVCALLGVLFFVLMPLVGLLFCLCRCCDNCGGEMHQRQRKNADCQRGLLATLLFSTSLVITAGILCAYAANQHLSSQLKSMRRLVNSNLRDLHTFANDTPAQIDYLVSQYFTAKKYVTADLDNIGVLLGGRIYDELGKEVRPALDGVLNMAGAMHDTKEALENVSMTLEVLQDGNVKLQVNLSLVRSSLNESLDDPACEAVAHICGRIRSSLAQLDISANYSRLPDVADQLNNVNNVLKTDLDAIVQRGFLSFNNTPSLVAEQTTSVARGIKDMLDDIGSNITILPKLFSMHSPLTNFTISISHAHSKIEDLYPEIDRYDFYRWVGCITLCCMVVMVLAFNYLGLLCGILGFDRHATPTTRGCISNTGGNLLMAGVGFSFLFSWVLMAVVTTTFLAGGNVEKLVCEPFHTKELFKVLDTPYLIMPAWKNFIPGYLYNEPDMDLTIESLYTDCEENRGIYSALHLDRVFNITAFLNSRVYAKHVSQKIDGIRVDLRGIVLLETEGRKNLVDFTEAGIGDINYAAYLEEVSKRVTRVDLLSFASDLEAQSKQVPSGSLQTSLKNHVNSIRQIHAQLAVPMEQSVSTLNQSIRYLQATAADLPSKVSDVLNTVDVAQFLISHNASFVVSQETAKFRDTILGYIKQYLEWLVNALATEVAGCKPFSNIVDSLEIVGCSFLMDSMNTFWFGLGGATLFLLPSIIFAVKLAKFYRRMDTEDVYDDIETIPMKNMEIGNNGYHNERLQGVHNPVMASIPAYDTMTRFPRASAPPRHGNCAIENWN